MTLTTGLSHLPSLIAEASALRIHASVSTISGMELRAAGLGQEARIGSQVVVAGRVRGEIVGVHEGTATIVPYGSWAGIAAGDRVELVMRAPAIRPDLGWIGRVVDAFGNPLDGLSLAVGPQDYPYLASPPNAMERREVGEKLETGVRALDVFVPLCRGQRLGIFAGSGVGKSTLMSMLARHANADVIVIGLIGERGREVQSFIQRDLGPEGMSRSVLVVATSDQPSLTRRQAAWTATAVAEYFRDQGLHVLLMLDSVTRFAMAQREIGLSAGEPPTQKGYTPTVFLELPKLLERSGPGSDKRRQGDITAIYTVLVDGDDTNEPISDTVRGILDGHVFLDRKIAEQGRYPAINIQKSISRMLPHCHNEAENMIMHAARRAMARQADMDELIRIGAYQAGSDPEVDRAIRLVSREQEFLAQPIGETHGSMITFANLYGILLDCGFDLPRV